MDKNLVTEIVENACARAVLEFQKDVEDHFEKHLTDNWHRNRITAVEKSLPAMLKTALTLALSELMKEIDKAH